MDTQIVSGGLTAPARQEMEQSVSHLLGTGLLEILLLDHSRPKSSRKPAHIFWATDNYRDLGPAYAEDRQITLEAISRSNNRIIQPRVRKTKEEQQARARDKGEVFSPSWICNAQNNLIDKAWFGSNESPFNEESDKGWITKQAPIPFPTGDGKTWQDYVKDLRLEITCGEAPYLFSRYDAITGDAIPIQDRIGILDRKLRVVSENARSKEEWIEAAKDAYKATYGYEWQGDSLLLARQNALLSFIEHYRVRFTEDPAEKLQQEIAEIISWNLWQMDGLKGVIPDSCHEDVHTEESLFGDGAEIQTPCPGCESGDIRRHNGIYVRIMDWEKGKPVRYVDLIKK